MLRNSLRPNCDLLRACVRVEPELRATILSVGMCVPRLTAVVGVEIEAIGPTLRIVGIAVILIVMEASDLASSEFALRPSVKGNVSLT